MGRADSSRSRMGKQKPLGAYCLWCRRSTVCFLTAKKHKESQRRDGYSRRALPVVTSTKTVQRISTSPHSKCFHNSARPVKSRTHQNGSPRKRVSPQSSHVSTRQSSRLESNHFNRTACATRPSRGLPKAAATA